MLGSEKEESVNLNSLVALLIDQFNQMNDKLDVIVDLNQRLLKLQANGQRSTMDKGKTFDGKKQPDALTLISLPASLRKTVMTLYQLEKATAEELAKETNRMRAVESAAANQLVRLGYIKKKREGRDVYFYIEQTNLNEGQR